MQENGVPWLKSSAIDQEKKGRHIDDEANLLKRDFLSYTLHEY